MGKRILVIGQIPPGSPEPALLVAALGAVGIEAEATVTTPAGPELAAAIGGLRERDVVGGVIGEPYRERAASLAGRLAPEAQVTGAVDTLTREGTRAVGHHLEVAALRRGIDALVGRQKMPKAAVVLGAAGSARAAVHVLITSGFHQVAVFDERLHRAEALVRTFAKSAAHMDLRARPWHETVLESEIARTRILVDATGRGGADDAPLPAALLAPGLLVLDLSTAATETRLLRDAAVAGADRVMNGDLVLAHRSAAAVGLWTGTTPDADELAERLTGLRAGGAA